jgi:hypothetical protein
MDVASTDLADSYHQRARDWMDGKAQKSSFEEYHVIAAFAVAEYLANQDGYTLFPEVIEKDG